MNDNWRIQDYKINAYICKNNHVISVVDINLGHAPYELPCFSPQCESKAKSVMYQQERPVASGIPYPVIEFYRPSRKSAHYRANKEYLKKGGLLPRKLITPEDGWLRHCGKTTDQLNGLEIKKQQHENGLTRNQRKARRRK